MKSFSSIFTIEKNKHGTAPINLLTFGFDTPVYLSDRDITPPGGQAHQGLVQSWGFVDSAVQQTPGSGVMDAITTGSDLSLTIINSTTPRFSDNFAADDPPENVIVELYQYFSGLAASDAELIFKGIVDEVTAYTDRLCTLVVRGIWQKYNTKIGAGSSISQVDFPAVDPDDVGKMQNIVYGSVEKVPCRAIQSGAVNNIEDEISATATTIAVSDVSDFTSSGTVRCDDEEITYTGTSGDTLTGCTRGANGTTAVIHNAGAAIWQVLTEFVYQVAGHPVQAINDCYCDGVKITSVITAYTGQAGDELAGYEGMAVITVPRRLTRQQAIDILVDGSGMTFDAATNLAAALDVYDGITVSDATLAVTAGDLDVSTGSHEHGLYSYQTLYSEGVDSYSGANRPHEIIGNNIGTSSFAWFQYTTHWAKLIFVTTKEVDGTISQVRLGMHYMAQAAGCTVAVYFRDSSGTSLVSIATGTSNAVTAVLSSWVTVNKTWAQISGGEFYIAVTASSGTNPQTNIYSVWLEVKYTPDSSAADGVALSGGPIMEGGVDKDGSVSLTGKDDVSVTVTRNGDISLTGNSVADVTIGKVVAANVDGYADDGAGTITGTPAALIERPDHVFSHLWQEILGAPAADLDSTSFAGAGSFYASKSYSFGFAVTQPMLAGELFARLALQCRSRFFVTPAGKAKLLVRRTGQAAVIQVAPATIKRGSVQIRRSPVKDLFNSFNIYYNRDWSATGARENLYRSARFFEDAVSVSRYDARPWAGAEDIFCFDAVGDDAMVQDVGAFLLEWHSVIRNMPEFAVFLDHMEIEPGDVIGITHDLDGMAALPVEVLKIIHTIGSAQKRQIDHIKLTTISNT